MKLIWSKAAQSDMREIQHSLQCRSNRKTANHIIDRLIERALLLRQFPEMGHALNDSRYPGSRELVERPYRIRYRIVGQHRDCRRAAWRA